MTGTLEVLSKVLPVIFLIVLGALFRKTGFIKQDVVSGLKKIVVNVSLPAVLFLTFAETTFESRYLLIFLSVFLVCGVMLFIGTGLKRLLNQSNKYYPALFSGFETGMMGYSLFLAVYGAENIFKLALIDLGQVVFVFFVLVSYLQKLNGRSASARELIVSFVKSPVILSIILGVLASLLVNVSSISSPVIHSVMETLSLLSALTMPLICIVIGYELKINFKGIGKPFLTALIRILLLLGMAFIINTIIIEKLLDLDHTFKTALYTMFLLPPPFVIPIFMDERQEQSKQFVLNTISVSIILSLIAYIILIIVF